MKDKSIPNFDSLEDITLAFDKVSPKIVIENREYKHVGTSFKGETIKLVYRNDQEQHNLIITMLDDEVLHAEGIYSVCEVKLHAV